MKKIILKVLNYFNIFAYPPTFEEIYTFLPKKTSKKKLKRELENLVKKKIIENCKLKIENCVRYTLGEYSIKSQISNLKSQNYKKIKNFTTMQFNDFKKKYIESEKKLKYWKFRLYIKLLSLFPQIKLVGLSGSIAMMNAGKDDDIDLFIITGKGRLFTGRFIAIILAKILGIHRKREKIIKNTRSRFQVPSYPNKVCLNLFFDENNLEVPDFKKNEFVAHEVLQMRPLIAKDDIYQKFLSANWWVYEIFPNARLSSSKFLPAYLPTGKTGKHDKIQNSKLKFKIKNYFSYFKFFIVILRFAFYILNLITEGIEKVLKTFQLYFINRHRTSELITDNQLWFHPKDFSSRLRKILEFKN